MAFTSAQARALADQLVSDEVVIYPVRHHSPACAWHLRGLIAAGRPSAILVEGPRAFTAQIPLLVHPDARAPLAIYTYTAHRGTADAPDARRSAYYPFCDYSPELVALREAARLDIPSRFIDLNYAEQCHVESIADEEEISLLEERHFQRSVPLQALAHSLGCRDHEELWEHLFESDLGAVTWKEHLARVAAYCQLSREGVSREELAADGTAAREAEMSWHVREAIAARRSTDGPVLVVVGGYHAVALPDLLRHPPTRPVFSRGTLLEEDSALIRYSFDRLDRLNGYSAGMTSPGWHQRIWEQWQRHRPDPGSPRPRLREQAALDTLSDIADQLRSRHSLPLPMPTLAAAYEQTLQLACLRQRPAPVREDVLDAVTSCYVKGDADADGALVLSVARQMLCGVAVGVVPPGAHTPPLVKDVAWRLRRQRLKVDDARGGQTLLDIYRRPPHRLTSRLLHGLSFLGVPFAVRTAGPDFVNGLGLDRLQERWEYAYTAATEAALVEASVHGATLPLAVAHRFGQLMERHRAEGNGRDARGAATLVTRACVLGLHDHLPEVLAGSRLAISEDGAFESVVSAICQLGLLWLSREPLEARELEALPALLQTGYERASYLGLSLSSGTGDAEATITALAQLREFLVSQAGRDLDATAYWSLVAALQQRHDAPLVRGAATGLRYSAGLLDADALKASVHGHFLGLATPTDAIAYLRGLLRTARETAWQQPELLSVLDDLLRQWPQDVFVANLPELRLAFATMTPRETDRIAQAVAELHDVDSLGPLVHAELSADAVQHHLQVSEAVSDILRADGLDAWVSP